MADGDDGKSGFLAFWSSLPGVLTGVAAVLTAAIGLIGLWRSQDGGSEVAAPVTSGGATTTSRITTSTTATETLTPRPGVLAVGRLTMREDETANLKRKRVSTGDSEADLYLDQAGVPDFATLYAAYGGFLAEADAEADKAGCVAALQIRTSDRVRLADLSEPTTLCLNTWSGTIAAIRIVSPPAIGSPELVFDYTLWG